jgi:hypothetical protein
MTVPELQAIQDNIRKIEPKNDGTALTRAQVLALLQIGIVATHESHLHDDYVEHESAAAAARPNVAPQQPAIKYVEISPRQ